MWAVLALLNAPLVALRDQHPRLGRRPAEKATSTVATPGGCDGSWREEWAVTSMHEEGALTLASLALVFWGQPTGKVIIGLALALLVVLAIVQFLARPPQHTAVGSTPQT
jgi:hypothetical protein